MSCGTISELSPQDGLGWITLDEGARVRFGATACKGFVPSVGTRVSVLGTAPGYGGVTKATQVVPLPKSAAAAPTVAKRSNLAKLDALKIPADEVLRSIIARTDTDDGFYGALEHLMFEISPMPAADIDCIAPACSVIAMDGGGNAFGLYVTDSVQGTPWVFWDHEIDTLAFIAPDTLAFFSGLLAERGRWMKEPSHAERVRSVLRELGVAIGPFPNAEGFLEGQPVKWLPRGPLHR